MGRFYTQFLLPILIYGLAMTVGYAQTQDVDAQTEAAEIVDQHVEEGDEVDHDFVVLQTRLGRQAMGRGDYETALTALDLALSMDPMDPDALVTMGTLNEAQDKQRTAYNYYKTALAIDPDHLRGLSQMGRLFLKIGRADRAHTYLEKLGMLCPFGCAARSDLDDALASFEKQGKHVR